MEYDQKRPVDHEVQSEKSELSNNLQDAYREAFKLGQKIGSRLSRLQGLLLNDENMIDSFEDDDYVDYNEIDQKAIFYGGMLGVRESTCKSTVYMRIFDGIVSVHRDVDDGSINLREE